MAIVRYIRIILIVMTGFAAGVSWGALEQSPTARNWLSEPGPPA